MKNKGLEWTRLTVTNFLSYQHFTLDLEDRGIILVEGENLTSSKFKSNGSGKSSLMEPLVYAIYDTTSKGIKADKVVNRQAGKNTSVILEGRKGEDKYRIERYRKHTKNKNKVKFFINDKEVTAKSVADTNKMIEDLVGIDYNTFVNSIMFSQGNGAGRFAIATDKEKKEILENLVNLQVYANAQEIAKNRVKAKEAEILAKEREGERLEWELSQIDTLEQQDKQHYDNTKRMIEQEQLNLSNTREEMDNYIQSNSAALLQLIDDVEKLKEQREALNTSKPNPYADAVNTLTKVINEIRAKKQQLEYQKGELVKKFQQLKTNTNCPICGNELDSTHRDTEMASIREQLKPILVELTQTIPGELAHHEPAYEEAYARYSEEKAKQDNIVAEYRALTTQIETKEQHHRSYSKNLDTYKSKLASIQNTINKLESVPEPAPRDAERKAIKDKVKAQKEAILALKQEKLQLENAVKIFSNSGVKSHVLDLVTPFLNERANKYLAILSGPDMEVKFSTQTPKKDGEMTEKFDVQLTNAVGGEDYQSNSEGEKKRADLSIALALQDLVMKNADSKVNFAVYDEVFDALDSVGAENVVTLLKERQKEIGTIFVVTHSEHLKPLFEQVITVIKNKDGISTLEEGEKMT